MSDFRFQVTKTFPTQDAEGAVRTETVGIDVPADMTVGELVRRGLYSPPSFINEGRQPRPHTRAVLTIRAVTTPGDPFIHAQ